MAIISNVKWLFSQLPGEYSLCLWKYIETLKTHLHYCWYYDLPEVVVFAALAENNPVVVERDLEWPLRLDLRMWRLLHKVINTCPEQV